MRTKVNFSAHGRIGYVVSALSLEIIGTFQHGVRWMGCTGSASFLKRLAQLWQQATSTTFAGAKLKRNNEALLAEPRNNRSLLVAGRRFKYTHSRICECGVRRIDQRLGVVL